jgi:DNA-directed RNA polymerase subunit F
MASKRQLKKSINNLTYDLVSECFAFRHFHPEKSADVLNEIIRDIVKTRNELVTKINQAPADPKEMRSFYKAVVTEMKTMVNKLDKIATIK